MVVRAVAPKTASVPTVKALLKTLSVARKDRDDFISSRDGVAFVRSALAGVQEKDRLKVFQRARQAVSQFQARHLHEKVAGLGEELSGFLAANKTSRNPSKVAERVAQNILSGAVPTTGIQGKKVQAAVLSAVQLYEARTELPVSQWTAFSKTDLFSGVALEDLEKGGPSVKASAKWFQKPTLFKAAVLALASLAAAALLYFSSLLFFPRGEPVPRQPPAATARVEIPEPHSQQRLLEPAPIQTPPVVLPPSASGSRAMANRREQTVKPREREPPTLPFQKEILTDSARLSPEKSGVLLAKDEDVLLKRYKGPLPELLSLKGLDNAVVMASGDYCLPCKRAYPLMEEAASLFPGLRFYLIHEYRTQLEGTPQFLIYKNGKVVSKKRGLGDFVATGAQERREIGGLPVLDKEHFFSWIRENR